MKAAGMLVAALALASCGSASGLRAKPGQATPAKPYGAAQAPTPKQLQTPPPQARPARSDELIRSSEQRRGDDFDLPPS